jgi:hypothetical protein
MRFLFAAVSWPPLLGNRSHCYCISCSTNPQDCCLPRVPRRASFQTQTIHGSYQSWFSISVGQFSNLVVSLLRLHPVSPVQTLLQWLPIRSNYHKQPIQIGIQQCATLANNGSPGPMAIWLGELTRTPYSFCAMRADHALVTSSTNILGESAAWIYLSEEVCRCLGSCFREIRRTIRCR